VGEMNNKRFRVFLLVFTVLLGVNYVGSGFPVLGRISKAISVGRSIEDNYASIQEAINAAEPGIAINVEAGVYYENVVVNKSVSLFGKDMASTIVDGGGNGHVFSVEASNVIISGFTLRNSGIGKTPYSGVRLFCSNDSLISNNVIVNNQYGVWLSYSNNNTISGNVVAISDVYGVRLYQSENNTLVHNYVEDNEYGIYVYASSEGNVIRYNNLSGNSFGLYFGLSDGNLGEGNTVVDSTFAITLRQSGRNFIFHNNFVSNRFQVNLLDAFANVWDDGYPSGGNYWGDYCGVDEFYGVNQSLLGSDGLGDMAYGDDVNNRDNYPLMGFFSVFDVIWNESVYSVLTVCDSAITGLSLVYLEACVEIGLNVSGVEGTLGFCRISVPKVFLDGLENSEYIIVVNGNSSLLITEIESNGDYEVMYFTYVHGPFISEFTPSFLMLLILFLTFVILFRKLLAVDKKQV